MALTSELRNVTLVLVLAVQLLLSNIYIFALAYSTADWDVLSLCFSNKQTDANAFLLACLTVYSKHHAAVVII